MKNTSYLSIAIISFLLLSYFGLLNQSQATSLTNSVQWEYGIYNATAGKYAYQWIDNQQHIHASNEQAFFEKLKIADTIIQMDAKYKNTSPPFKKEIIDLAILNHLGEMGWELIKQENRYFLFRRPIQKK